MQQSAVGQTVAQEWYGTPAAFGERLVAVIIDSVIMVVVGFVVGLFFPNQAMSSLIGLLIGVTYYIGFWTTQGATPGKMVMGLRVVDRSSGLPPDPLKCGLRYIGYYISAIPLLLGYLWVLWDPNKEAWHDKISGTRVVKAK